MIRSVYVVVALALSACGGGDSPEMAAIDGAAPDMAATQSGPDGGADGMAPEVDLCEGVRCGPYGECIQGACSCDLGFEIADGVCVDLDECALNTDDCHEDALCQNTLGSYECTCAPGYRGDGRGCEDIHECDERLDNCADHALCTNTDGGFECACVEGYVGDGIACVDLNECEDGSAQCDPNSECVNIIGAYECQCRAGWAADGAACGDIDECAGGLDNCSDNALCRNVPGSFVCECLTGWSGDGVVCADDDECALNLAECGANSTCQNSPGAYECRCDEGFTAQGEDCRDVDECVELEGVCDVLADCVNTVGGYECVCPEGYVDQGGRCADVDECASPGHGCGLGSRCVNTPGGFECVCADGYFMADGICVDADECAQGLDDCHVFADCLNRPGTFDCACQPGFEGDGRSCLDVDECGAGQVECQPNSNCVNQPGSYACLCEDGYRADGARCVNIDECAEGIAGCAPEADCIDEEGTYACTCRDGYLGDGFECQDINECLLGTDECPAELECGNLPGTYQCGGEVFFVCDCGPGAEEGCVPGVDEASGRRPDEPKRTFEAVRLAAQEPGASVRFCRGGSFAEDIRVGLEWICDADTPCVFGAYQPSWNDAVEAPPLLYGSVWVEDSIGPETRGHLVFEDLEIRGLGGPGDEIGFDVSSGVTDVIMRRLRLTGWRLGLRVGRGTSCNEQEACPNPVNIRLQDSVIEGNLSVGAEITGDGLSITGNTFRANGGDGARDHQLRLDCSDGTFMGLGCGNVQIARNVFRQTTGSLEPGCSSSAIMVEGLTQDTRIESNDIRELAENVTSTCQGIIFARSARSATRYERAVIANNILVNSGVTAIGLSSCLGCTIENNRVSHDAPVYSISIRAPMRRGGGDHAVMTDLTVRNNSIYMGPRTRFTSIAVFVNGFGGGHQIVSNAIVNLSEAGTTCCFDQSFDLSIYEAFDYNICQTSPNNANANWALGYSSLGRWQEVSGFDEHSSTVDPGFLDPGPEAADFRARSGESAIVDAGDPALSSARDPEGVRRLIPDIGALEWQAP